MFEEVKEMIDSTIYTNGRGEVTAQNVNLAMQAIVEATEGKIVSLEENGLSSSGALKVWLWDEEVGIVPTEEQIAENIATYNKLLDGNHSGVILCADWILPDDTKTTLSINVCAQAINSVGESYVVLQGAQPKMNSNNIQTFLIQLNADGTMVISNGEDSASSGPLRVWVYYDDISELTPEQVAENVETYKAICKGEHNAVVLCGHSKDQYLEGHSTITSTQTLAIKASDEEIYDVGIYFDNINIISGKKELVTLILSQDGSLEVHYWEEPSTPSGRLRVWVPFEEELALTEEQKVENADTLAELVNGYAGLVYIVSQAKFQEEHAYSFYTITNIADSWESGVMEEEGKMAFLSSTSGLFYLYEDGTTELIDD